MSLETPEKKKGVASEDSHLVLIWSRKPSSSNHASYKKNVGFLLRSSSPKVKKRCV